MNQRNKMGKSLSLAVYIQLLNKYLIRTKSEQLQIPLLNLTSDIEDVPNTHAGTSFVRYRILQDIGQARKVVASYIIKHFISENGNISRQEAGKNPAWFEFTLLSAYSEKGCNVPHPLLYEKDDNKFLMTDLGEDTLEKRLAEGKEESEDLFGKVVLGLPEFHRVGREIQKTVLSCAPEKVLQSRNLEKRARKYFRILNENKYPSHEENNFIEKIGFVFDGLKSNKQLIHGDLTTFHTVFTRDKNGMERVGFIDLGSPKLACPAHDYASILFAPNTRINVEKAMEIYEATAKERLNMTLMPERIRKSDNLALAYAGVYYCLKAATGIKKLKKMFPSDYVNYLKLHPSYTQIQNYANNLKKIGEYAGKGKMFGEEGKKVEKACENILNLIEESCEKDAEKKVAV